MHLAFHKSPRPNYPTFTLTPGRCAKRQKFWIPRQCCCRGIHSCIGYCTVKLAVLLVPTELVSVTFCGPVGAFAAIVNVTVMLVPSLPKDALLVVIPAPENPTTTSLERLVPLMVTLNAVPRVPDVGVKLVI